MLLECTMPWEERVEKFLSVASRLVSLLLGQHELLYLDTIVLLVPHLPYVVQNSNHSALHYLSTKLHGLTPQKTTIFIQTTVRT